MTTDEKIDEVLKTVHEQGKQLLLLIQEQGEHHERRFAQVDANFARLDAKIDKVFDSLSQDIQIFAEDLHHVKRRVTRLEKKFVS